MSLTRKSFWPFVLLSTFSLGEVSSSSSSSDEEDPEKSPVDEKPGKDVIHGDCERERGEDGEGEEGERGEGGGGREGGRGRRESLEVGWGGGRGGTSLTHASLLVDRDGGGGGREPPALRGRRMTRTPRRTLQAQQRKETSFNVTYNVYTLYMLWYLFAIDNHMHVYRLRLIVCTHT